MPRVEFSALPSSARVWVFGAQSPLSAHARDTLFQAVDAHLDSWRAHGVPLVCARDWHDDRFLAIGVDEAATGASGCSIDGLFRILAALQDALGTSLIGGGNIFWRNLAGQVVCGSREDFANAIAHKNVTDETRVFDLTVGTVGDWQHSFERKASASWHARLLSSRNANREQ